MSADVDPAAMRARLGLVELAGQMRADQDTVADPHTRTLLATTADLLLALEEAFANAGHDHSIAGTA